MHARRTSGRGLRTDCYGNNPLGDAVTKVVNNAPKMPELPDLTDQLLKGLGNADLEKQLAGGGGRQSTLLTGGIVPGKG